MTIIDMAKDTLPRSALEHLPIKYRKTAAVNQSNTHHLAPLSFGFLIII